jgi:hypothetical protein
MAGDQGREQARRRFGDRARTLEPEPSLAEREFELEDLLEAGGRGRAHAAMLHGNASAREALNDLARLEREIAAGLPSDYQPPADDEHPWGAA